MGGRHEDEILLICGEPIKELPIAFEEISNAYDDFKTLWKIVQSCYSSRFYERAFATWAFACDMSSGDIDIWFDTLVGNAPIYQSDDPERWVFVYKHSEIKVLKERLENCKIPPIYARSFDIMMNSVEVAFNEGWDLVVGFKGDTWSECGITDNPS
jgi:hypothetical protein